VTYQEFDSGRTVNDISLPKKVTMGELEPRFVFCSAPKMSKQSSGTEMLFDMALNF
jgi:hypothetical protein